MLLKFLLSFLLSTSVWAHQVQILGRLLPAGSFEIQTKSLYGDLVFIKSSNSIKSQRLSFRTDSLDTGIELRNEHLYKYLNAKKFPRIFIEKVEIKNGKGKGKISINGISKVISFPVIIEKKVYISKFKVIPSQFKLKPAKFMGVSVVDKIEVTITVNKEEILRK
ncbi:MAG: YceI family protein [Bacteriovoracaceae bacterium]|nr:YceI family protein [Bacteriovoracaceae bacterium]